MLPPGRLGGRARLAPLAALTLGAAAAACSPTDGYIELAWAFVDRQGEPIFPNGELKESCSFRGPVAPEGEARTIDLRVELRLCDPECAGGCDDPACLVTEPLRFACLDYRGHATVPASEGPYLFETRVIAEIDGDAECACAISSACVQVPGPRQRMVRPGLVTDLQVYQLILDIADPTATNLDLSPCCDLPDTCAP